MYMTIYDYDTTLLATYKQYYILGCDEKALGLAIRLLNAGIYFHGFLSLDNQLRRGKLWNKPVINVNECINNEDIAVITSLITYYDDMEKLKSYFLENRLILLEILKSLIIDSANVVIYGNGSQGKIIYEKFSEHMNISHFCSSFERYWGETFCGKAVISPQELAGLPDDTVIIIASNAYQKIYETLAEYRIEKSRIYCSENTPLIFHPCCILEKFFSISKLMLTLQMSQNITLYGEESVVEEVKKKLALLDFHNIKTIGRKSLQEDGSVFELLYYDWDNTYLYLTDDMNLKVMQSIEKMKIPTRNIYWLRQCDGYYSYDYMSKSEFIPDPTLGYSAIELGNKSNDSAAGFVKYEYSVKNERTCTILTLGGSTTQCFAVRETSWSELLSRILTEKKIPHRIFCGGISGYSNIQEFLKLVRDGIILKPDIVLSYSGVNNTNWLTDPEYPFIHTYQKQLFKRLKMSRGVELGEDTITLSDIVNYGIANSEQDSFQFWLLYERLMNSICKELSIKFKAYLQPWLFSKSHFDEYDRRILLGLFHIVADTRDDLKKYAMDTTQKFSSDVEKALIFRKEVKQYEKLYSDWLVDFSHILDEASGVYIDEAHVYEWGNQIIAEHMYKSIEQDILEILQIGNNIGREQKCIY